MKGVSKFRDRLRRDLKDPKFRQAFEDEDLFARLAIEIAKLREKQGMSQVGLARRLRTSQQMISRLEDPHNKSFSLNTLAKLAQAFHKKLKVGFV